MVLAPVGGLGPVGVTNNESMFVLIGGKWKSIEVTYQKQRFRVNPDKRTLANWSIDDRSLRLAQEVFLN